MKLLVVVDYQNDFVDGSLGFEGAELLDKGIAKKVREYGEGNVLYTLDSHYTKREIKKGEIYYGDEEENERWHYLNTREGKALPIEHCIRLTEGWEIYGETAKALEEVRAKSLEKVSFGVAPFTMEKLDRLYDSDEIESIELVGLVTNMCIISNAVIFQATYPEAQIIVDARLCNSFDKELHEKSLDVLEGLQVTVLNR